MTQPISVATALARGCSFCKCPLAPEAALLIAASFEIVDAPQTRSTAQAGICCLACFDKHAKPADMPTGDTGQVADAEPSRHVLYDFDAGQLVTTRVFNSYGEAADAADGLNDVIVVPLPVDPPTLSLAEEDEAEPCECEVPDQPFYSGVPGILARLDFGRVVPDTKVQRCDMCERYESDDAALEKLRELGLLWPEPPPATTEATQGRASMYRGRSRFDREQLIFVVEAILAAALDRVECDLPSEMALYDRLGGPALSDYERGGLEAAVAALGLLYTRITSDRQGVNDALCRASRFDEACERLVKAVREDKGARFKDREERLRASGRPTELADVYGTLWPDTRNHAQQFVDECFEDYLKAAEPRAEVVLGALADFVQGKAELGRIDWENDAPVFWGILEDAQAIAARDLNLTPAQRHFFEVEIENERHGGIRPATLDSAIESLEQAAEDVIAEWCADESVTAETAQDFVAGLSSLRDRLGGHVELRVLIDADREH